MLLFFCFLANCLLFTFPLQKFSHVEKVPSCFIVFKTKKGNLLPSHFSYESMQSSFSALCIFVCLVLACL